MLFSDASQLFNSRVTTHTALFDNRKERLFWNLINCFNIASLNICLDLTKGPSRYDRH